MIIAYHYREYRLLGLMHVKHFTHSWAISIGVTHSVHPPSPHPLRAGGGGGLNLLQNFQKVGA